MSNKSVSPVMATTAGAPVADKQNTLTAGPRGPVMLQDWQLIEKLAHQNRERIPERVVHAKGWGAFKTQQGHKFLTNAESATVIGKSRESYQEDLFHTIEGGDYR